MRISDWSSDVCSSDLKPLERTVRDDHHLAQVRLLREADVVRLRWRHPVLHDLMQNARFADTIGADQGIHIVWQWVVGLELQFERRDIPADIVKLESKVEHRGRLALQDPPAIEKGLLAPALSLQRVPKPLAVYRSEEHTSELQSLMRIS